MISAARRMRGRGPVLTAAGHDLFARHAIWRTDEPAGYQRDGAVVWLPATERLPLGAVGAAGPAIDLLADLLTAGVIGAGRYAILPRTTTEALAGRLPVARHDMWDFRWTAQPPPPQPGEHQVIRLTEADHPALAALIARAFPESTARPGDPRIVDWYGIRIGGRLVACGADRSRGDVGFLAGLAVAPELRGRGLGAALTAGMSRALFARFEQVALGVFTHNQRATRLYQRLGFTRISPRSSVVLR